MAQGIREYNEKRKSLTKTRQSAKQLDAKIKDKNAKLDKKSLKPITDNAGIDIDKVPETKKSSPNMLNTLKKGIDIGKDTVKTYKEVKEAVDPFINSKGGLGTFADLEKLLKTAGGFLGAISLLSKFFKLDLTTVENLNDTTINKIAPGTTETLLDTTVPSDKVNIPKFPKITKADENREGGELANNVADALENKHNQAATEIQMGFGKTENKIPELKPPAPIQFEPEPNRDKYESKTGEFTRLLELQTIELPKIPGASSKIEGSVQFTPTDFLRNANIPLKSMSITLNLKLEGNTLIGNAFVKLDAQDNVRDATYNGNISTVPLQIRTDDTIIGAFTVNKNYNPFGGEQSITFNTVNSGTLVGQINRNEKTVTLNVYSPKLAMTDTNPIQIKGNYEE